MEEKEVENKWMEFLHMECVLQISPHYLCAMLAFSHTTDTDFPIIPPLPLLSHCLHITFSFLLEKLNALLLSCHSSTVLFRPTLFLKYVLHPLLIEVLTKQQKEAVYCCVYFPSLRCGFLTTKLGLFWESSTSKT